MFKSRLALAAAGAMVLVMAASETSLAQSSLSQSSNPEHGGRAAPGSSVDPNPVAGTRDTSASRVRGNRRAQVDARARAQAEATAVDPATIKAEAETLFAATGTQCQITEAKLLGQTSDKTKIYEAACASGPGYIILASTPPQAMDCLVLASSAEQTRARDPNADVGSQCSLPANDNAMAVFTAFAKEAGLPCTVDQGAIIGAKPGGAIVYEIGCAGVEGAQINKAASGWEVASCMELVSANASCRFTTPAEQVATLKGWLAGSEAAACDISQARYMGKNANGSFYEAACNGADGVIVRFDTAKAVQQVYPCATAQQIGGCCKLTTTAPAAAPNS